MKTVSEKLFNFSICPIHHVRIAQNTNQIIPKVALIQDRSLLTLTLKKELNWLPLFIPKRAIIPYMAQGSICLKIKKYRTMVTSDKKKHLNNTTNAFFKEVIQSKENLT